MMYYHEGNGMDDTTPDGWVAATLARLDEANTPPWTDATADSERTGTMSTYTDPQIAATFHPASGGGYTSRSGGGFISCPPYVVASVASRLDPHLIEWPEGYDGETLDRVQGITGWVDRDVHISPRQAGELADLGRQILALHKDGKTELGYFEQQSIEHLVSLASSEERQP